jgi:transcription elongation factor Elf1
MEGLNVIKFACPNCGKHLSVADEAAGKNGKCPKCGGKVQVPAQESVLPAEAFVEQENAAATESVNCELCGQSMEMDKDELEMKRAAKIKIWCSKCFSEFAPKGAPAQRTCSGPKYTMKGTDWENDNAILRVFEDRLTMTAKKGAFAMNETEISIPFSSLTAVQHEDGIIRNKFSFITPAGSKIFQFSGQAIEAYQVKSFLEKIIREAHSPKVVQTTGNCADELQKLVDMKREGMLNEAEFQAAKKRLLG